MSTLQLLDFYTKTFSLLCQLVLTRAIAHTFGPAIQGAVTSPVNGNTLTISTNRCMRSPSPVYTVLLPIIASMCRPCMDIHAVSEWFILAPDPQPAYRLVGFDALLMSAHADSKPRLISL